MWLAFVRARESKRDSMFQNYSGSQPKICHILGHGKEYLAGFEHLSFLGGSQLSP